ncbi:hypothetical protein G9A89_010007 [Geosiphon pyriformis]|nr:hypothetical protein G9A89_010007 [Geosiphon pyriformis]
MEIPDHIYTIAQQLFQALSQQQLDMEINYPEILLHSDIETITINQWRRMNNIQVEDMRNRVEQTILEKKVLELIQNKNFNRA